MAEDCDLEWSEVRAAVTWRLARLLLRPVSLSSVGSWKVLTFQVGNQPGVLNPSPAVEMVHVRFICAHPASMAVTPVYKQAVGAPPCPLPQHHKQMVSVEQERPLRISGLGFTIYLLSVKYCGAAYVRHVAPIENPKQPFARKSSVIIGLAVDSMGDNSAKVIESGVAGGTLNRLPIKATA